MFEIIGVIDQPPVFQNSPDDVYMMVGDLYQTVFSTTVSYYGYPITVGTPKITGTTSLPSFITYNPVTTILSYDPTLVS